MYINWLAIIVAATISFVLGWIWYSSPVFGREWRRLSGISEEYHMQMAQDKKLMWKTMVMYFVSLLVLGWGMSYAVVFAGSYSVSDALQLGLCIWFGFAVPATLGSVLWERKTWKYYGINIGYMLLAMLSTSVVLTLWL